MVNDNEIVDWCDECSLKEICIRYSPGYYCPKEGIGEEEDEDK